jgi:putative ABC transport system substrate-binding protein
MPIQSGLSKRKMRHAWGILSARSPGPSEIFDAFIQGLRDHGYTVEKNIIIEYRFANEKYNRLPSLIADLMNFRPDVIFTHTTPGVLAAKRATKTIPIVIGAAGDLVEQGIVASLARPRVNITGLSFVTLELHQKRLELLKEAVPEASRVAVLVNPANPLWNNYPQVLQNIARKVGLELQRFEARNVEELQVAFSTMATRRVEAVLAVTDTVFGDLREQLTKLSLKNRLPVISERREFAEAGGLIAYGVDIPDMFRRAAFYVDKILTGVQPQDLPIERPMRATFAINLKTAKVIGSRIPPEVLQRADRVIR